MNRILFQGIMPALVSPVNEDGSIREAVLRRLVLDLSATGITGFYLLGGTGEGVIMDPARRMELAEIAKDCAPQGMKLINHIAATDLSTVKKLARHARAIGLDAIASVPPTFAALYATSGLREAAVAAPQDTPVPPPTPPFPPASQLEATRSGILLQFWKVFTISQSSSADLLW